MKKVLIIIGVILIIVSGIWKYEQVTTNKDLREVFLKQVKNLPNGDLSSTQCKKMFEDLKKQNINSSLSYRVAEDYVYINSKKMCIALTENTGHLFNNKAVTIIDLGTNNIYYNSFSYRDSLNISIFGKAISTSTILFTSQEMFVYLKDNLK